MVRRGQIGALELVTLAAKKRDALTVKIWAGNKL